MNHVTVLLPVYNGSSIINDAIESLSSQTHSEFTAYVVDDSSDDGTADLVSSIADERFRVVRSTQNVGIPMNWNRALDLVETPYFVLAHQDDIYEREFLATMLQLITH